MADDALALPTRPRLPKMTPEERAEQNIDERRAEAFLLFSMGWTQTKIARQIGVSQATVARDLDIEVRRRHSRAQLVEDEIERVAGIVEAVITKAWQRHNEAADNNINSVAGSNYLKLVLDGAEKYAQIRGIESVRSRPEGPKGQTRVIVQIGGQGGTPPIAVGVET